MNFGKIRSEPQGLIHGRITQRAPCWGVIEPIKVEKVVGLRDEAIRERKFTILLRRFFQ
jgi:hypothetical protein